jgi:hypothetical protein
MRAAIQTIGAVDLTGMMVSRSDPTLLTSKGSFDSTRPLYYYSSSSLTWTRLSLQISGSVPPSLFHFFPLHTVIEINFPHEEDYSGYRHYENHGPNTKNPLLPVVLK